MLNDGTIHGVIQRTGVGQKGLGFNLCVTPPHDRVVPDFGVTEIMEVFRSRPEETEVFWSRPEETEETRGA